MTLKRKKLTINERVKTVWEVAKNPIVLLNEDS
jgi:hypothetical protein